VRPLVNALLRQLDALISLVETSDDSSWYRSELLELKKKLEEAKKASHTKQISVEQVH
jgi:hypothetical protein